MYLRVMGYGYRVLQFFYGLLELFRQCGVFLYFINGKQMAYIYIIRLSTY